MNSLFQTMFMNPPFRQAIFDLPLCDGDINTASDFLRGGKRRMLLEIQKLFVFLQEANSRAWSTKTLTEAFGWGQAEGQ